MKQISLNNRDLSSIRLKGVTYFPKLGNLGPTLELNEPNKGLAKIVFMKKVEGGVWMQAIANIGKYQGQTVEAFIPYTSLHLAEFKDISETDSQEAGNSEGRD